MTLIIKFIMLFLIFIMGFFANRLEEHLKPNFVETPFLFNTGKILSYFSAGLLMGLTGFFLKIHGYIGGMILLSFSIGVLIVTLSHIPKLPKLVVIGLHSHHHHKISLPAGLLNIFSSSPSLHIALIIALARGYYLESGYIMVAFALGTLYIPGRQLMNFNTLYRVLRILLFLGTVVFISSKGLLYSELYLFSPFESKKTAVVPEVLDSSQYLKTSISEMTNRILISSGHDLNWMIQGEKEGDTIYIPRFRHKSRLNDDYESLVIEADKPGFIFYTGNFGKIESAIKILEGSIDVFTLPYLRVMDSGYGDDIHGEGYLADQNVPDIEVDKPGIATITENSQSVSVSITKKGFKPSVVVLKKGVPAIINFVVEELTEENKRIIMPSYNEYLEFSSGENPINIPSPLFDFIYYSWHGDFGGYILIVDDTEGITEDQIRRQIRMFNVNGL